MDMFFGLLRHSSHYSSHQLTRQRIDAASSMAEKAADRVGFLEERVARLELLNQVLWELMRDRVGVSEDELLAKVEEVDLLDGRIDGRGGPAPRICKACSRKVAGSRQSCLYCGGELGPPA